MCGIAGIYFFSGEPVPEQPLQKMGDSLAHRGPDDQGIHLNGNVGLVHRRLKIIDLSAAASQPMKDEQSRYSLIFNGEIYNFRQLRKNLEPKHSFFSQSDTEVILRCFEQLREGTWSLLNGMFSIAIYDSAEGELFLARDHAGVKPLYYYQDRKKLLFSSELKALFRSGLIHAEIDSTALALYLQLGYFPGAYTPYKRIKKLKQGEYARVTEKGVEIHQYWGIRSFIGKAAEVAVNENAAEKLDELLRNSVEQQMISDVPVGAFLSGGIDSSLIVALMCQVTTSPVRTFTAGFSRMGYYDERAKAARVSKLFRTEHHEFVVETRVDEIIPRLISVFDEPFADSSAIPTLCLAELARKYVTVALSGTGGDEIFGGYRKYLAAHWASKYTALPEILRSTVRKTADLVPSSRRSLWQERALLLQRFSMLRPNTEINLQLNSIFTLGETCELIGSAVEPEFIPISGTVAENMMLFDYESYLAENLLVKEDRCTMAFGLEARVPYLDRKVIEFMTSLPLKYKVSTTGTKRLLRKVAKSYLPKWVIQRPKHGFGAPVAEWLRSDLKTMAHDVLFSAGAYLKAPLIRNQFEEHQKGSDHSRQLWALLMLELWYSQSAKGL